MAPTAHRRVALLGAAALVWMAAGCAAGGTAARDELLRRGDRYAADRDYRAAIIQYKNALKRDPASAIAQRKLAESYLALQQIDKALEAYLRALATDRHDVVSHLRAGSLFLLSGDAERAASHARDAIGIDATNIEARVLLANALAGLRDVRGAIAQLEEGVALSPSE